MVEARSRKPVNAARPVSIRRADYWLVEALSPVYGGNDTSISIRRADYWLVEGLLGVDGYSMLSAFQSAGRIIGWLKALVAATAVRLLFSFNPPGGLLVG